MNKLRVEFQEIKEVANRASDGLFDGTFDDVWQKDVIGGDFSSVDIEAFTKLVLLYRDSKSNKIGRDEAIERQKEIKEEWESNI